MNHVLSNDFQAFEVDNALKQMFLTTAPRPDGMPLVFYQKFWSTVSPVVTNIILNFLNLGVCPLNFNHTHIVLIPK